jgi:hypothetical protein
MFFEQDKFTKNQKRLLELLRAQESLEREIKKFFEETAIDPATLQASSLEPTKLPEAARALLKEMLAEQEKPHKDTPSLPRPFGISN